jgi:HK97 family phage major capsid protein
MVKLTTALKGWLAENMDVAADAADEVFEKAASDAFFQGKLDQANYVKLTADPDAAKAESLEQKLDQVLTRLNEEGPATATKAAKAPAIPSLAGATADTGESSNKAGLPRHKPAHEQYDNSHRDKFYPAESAKGVRHPFAGLLVCDGDGVAKRPIQEPSRRDLACVGAYLKLCLHGTRGLPSALRLTDHDKELLQYAVREMEWGGVIGSKGSGDDATQGAIAVKARRLNTDGPVDETKALIDDATSGGLEAAPIVFDDMIITTPLLFGEFYPSVNVIPITRGRRIEGVQFSIPTIQSGGADNDNIDLFNTTNFITAFDTNIFVADAAIEVGLDFLSDSPVDVTAVIVDGYSRRLLAWLDEQICIGDGSTEPEGITVASGTTSVAGGSAAPTVGVYESFFFGVPKRFKQGYPNERIMFGANETTYMRARAIAVGASDARRIFGMTHGDYMLMNHKYGISDAMANTQAFYANMARYRMYRRLGMTIRSTSEGQTLVRKNLVMISCRSRWGGQLEDGGAAAYSSTMQA